MQHGIAVGQTSRNISQSFKYIAEVFRIGKKSVLRAFFKSFGWLVA